MSDPYAQIAAPDPQATPTQAPDPQALETARSTVEHLINTGASKDQIVAFMAAHGLAERSGIDAALAARDHGMKVHIPVQLVMPAAPASPADDPYAHLADPLQESSDPGADPLQAHGLGDELGIGARAILNGIGQLPDAAAKVGDLLDPSTYITGIHSKTDFGSRAANGLSDLAGFATPQTDGENLASAAISAATGGLLTAPLGGEGAFPALASTLSGAGAGGASELARQNGAGPIGQLAAGIAGGFAGPVAMAGAGRVAGAFAPEAERALSPTMQAFHDQNVPALPADVGGWGTRALSAGTSKLTLGGIPMERAAKASIAGTQAAADRVASSIGNVADQTGAGLAARRGANTFLTNSNDTAGRLYDAIPIAANTSAKLDNTRQALAQITRGLESNPELSAIMADPKMQRIARALMGETVEEPTGLLAADGTPITRTVQKGGALSWQDLKDFRSEIGEKAGAPALQSDTSQQKLKALYGALSQDMQATAQAEGPQAAAAFNRANTYWRARQQRIDDVITPILGKDGANTPDEAFKAIQSWAGSKADFVRTAQALRSLPEEEANTVRATIFNRLGRAAPGAQDVDGNVFSPATFMTNYSKLAQNPRVLNVLFPGEQYQKDLRDLLTIADAQKSAAKLGQGSPTAHLLQGAHATARILHFFTSPLTATADAVGELAMGHLMSSPKFARWLASSVKKPNAAAQLAHIGRLNAIAVSQPAIANDVLNLQSRLREAFAQSPQPLAAQPQEQGQ